MCIARLTIENSPAYTTHNNSDLAVYIGWPEAKSGRIGKSVELRHSRATVTGKSFISSNIFDTIVKILVEQSHCVESKSQSILLSGGKARWRTFVARSQETCPVCKMTTYVVKHNFTQEVAWLMFLRVMRSELPRHFQPQ
jgi:hypothetical protein